MRTHARWAMAITAPLALAACATVGAAAAPSSSADVAKTLSYYAFDVNNGASDPGFIPVQGTNPKVYSQGDELIINDQLTSTQSSNGGYPIVGRDSGVCTLTRIASGTSQQAMANCVVTAVWTYGTLTIQGEVSFKAQQPAPAVLAITAGTGRFEGAIGTVSVAFTKQYKILTIALK
jgi:Dirigent-like protein